MTTIAYHPDNGGMLAADTLVDMGGTILYGPKLYRLEDGSIFGGSGDSAAVNDVVTWLNGGGKGKVPKFAQVRAIHVKADGVYLYAVRATPTKIDRTKPAAIGSGMDCALGILRTGGSAEAAVRAAMLVDTGTGGDVETIYLQTSPA